MPRPHRFTDEQLLDLLGGSPSISALEDSLGYHHGAIKLRCRQVPELWLAYSKCKDRGTQQMRGTSPGQTPRCCAICGSPSHDRRFCGKRRNLIGKHCPDCAGLPHRRREPLCHGCLLPYEPEPEITMEQILEQPCHARRELI